MINSHRPYTTRVSPLHFFALSFTLSWLVWIPLDLSHFGIALHIPESTSTIVRLLGVLMPAVSAIFLSGVSGETGAIRKLLSRLTLWRVRWTWWVAATLVYPGILVLTALGYNFFIGNPPVKALPQGAVLTLIINIVFLLIAVLGEEIGWHGIALPAMQQKHSALVSSLILGFFWGVWHLPFWLLLDTFDQFGILYLVLNLIFVFPMTFYSTWFFNHSRYSIMLPVAFHLTFNIVNTALLPVTMNVIAFGSLIGIGWVLVFIILPKLEGLSSSHNPVHALSLEDNGSNADKG